MPKKGKTKEYGSSGGTIPYLPSGITKKLSHQALEATEYEYQTLARDKRIAETFEFKRRRLNLSHAHHAEVASLEPEKPLMVFMRAGLKSFSVSGKRVRR